MITVDGSKSDYAIMKQVQQLSLHYPQMAVVPLDDKTDFSKIGAEEPLYLVGHGSMEDGDFRDIKRSVLLGWLSAQVRGVPPKFGGIFILSCYSGLDVEPPEVSLAAAVATRLTGHVAANTSVAGANGYSFGTPEFRNSGLSSVLPLDLAAFYFLSDNDEMSKAWLAHKPTHIGGVLKDQLGIDVDTGKTIEQNLATIKQSKKSPEEIAQEYVIAFAKDASAIEVKLADIIENKIPGNSVADRANYLVKNVANLDVIEWNKAIDAQYKLFGDFYLWAPQATAFTVVKVT